MVANSFGNRNFMQPMRKFRVLNFFSWVLGRGYSFVLCLFPSFPKCCFSVPNNTSIFLSHIVGFVSTSMYIYKLWRGWGQREHWQNMLLLWGVKHITASLLWSAQCSKNMGYSFSWLLLKRKTKAKQTHGSPMLINRSMNKPLNCLKMVTNKCRNINSTQAIRQWSMHSKDPGLGL